MSTESGSRGLVAWGRLLRLSLAPSALADAAAGVVVGAGGWPSGWAPWLLIAASGCVYHGGMALNDWADRGVDARERPERPIPSGAVGASAALASAVLLLAGGVALAFVAAPVAGALLAVVAAAAIVYDLAGRGAVRGPLLLGVCRAGNLGAGVLLGGHLVGLGAAAIAPVGVPLALAYGAYVFVVSRLGRYEDGEAAEHIGSEPRRLVRGAALLLALAGLVAGLVQWVRPGDGMERAGVLLGESLPLAPWAGLALGGVVAALGARGLWEASQRTAWTRGDVLRTMGLCLRRLLIVTAAFACGSGTLAGVLVGLAILGGYPVSRALRGWFPPS